MNQDSTCMTVTNWVAQRLGGSWPRTAASLSKRDMPLSKGDS